MGVFDNKKPFAFDESAKISESKSVDEFVKSGAGDTANADEKKGKGGRPKKSGDKLVPINMYVKQEEKERIEAEAAKLHMSLSAYLKNKVLS